MLENRHPAEIARDVLKRLATQRLAPTPANYQDCYNEIAKLPNAAPFPEPALRKLAAGLTPRTPLQSDQLAQLDAAIGRRSWQGVQEALATIVNCSWADSVQPGTAAPPPPESSGRSQSPVLMVELAQMLEGILPALSEDGAETPVQFRDLLLALRNPQGDPGGVHELLGSVSRRLSFAAEEQVEIKHSLLHLLQLIIENISQLSVDDSWLKGQADALLHAVEPPLTLRRLDDVERRLKEVLFKQTEARSRSIEAQEEVRQMLASFVERLGQINESSNTFQGTIEKSAREIAEAKRIEDLAPLLRQVIAATRSMADDTAKTREHLCKLQERVLAAQAELAHLHMELDSASSMARHDPLTDALNRKGLDEALAREITSSRHRGIPLSVCLLDIDNFKKLNDRLGHQAGDAALVHLADIARTHLRPQDTLARYGGEEFVILMPDTELGQGIEAMKRLQRELTRNLFMADKEHVLITFSAGVAQVGSDESAEEVVKRADQAMYLAKRAGKNRVMSC